MSHSGEYVLRSRLLLIAFVAVLMTACSSHQPAKSPALHSKQSTTKIPKSKPKHPSLRQSISQKQNLKQKLLNQYTRWKGAPYRLGGLNRKGIDCSGFVYLTYKDQLKTLLPRTTKMQSQTGKLVKYRQKQIGDLLFFKTGVKVRHVGIYLGEQQFMHASTSQGVVISNLNNPYWQRSFWKVKRIRF